MCAQVSNAHGWHGAQKKARANEQQKQHQPQKLKQKLKQKQDKKQKQQQEQKQKQQRKQEQEQEQNGGGETGALAADGVEARMSQPLAHTCTASSGISRLLAILCSRGRSFVRRTRRWPSRRRAWPLSLCLTSGSGGSGARRARR